MEWRRRRRVVDVDPVACCHEFRDGMNAGADRRRASPLLAFPVICPYNRTRLEHPYTARRLELSELNARRKPSVRSDVGQVTHGREPFEQLHRRKQTRLQDQISKLGISTLGGMSSASLCGTKYINITSEQQPFVLLHQLPHPPADFTGRDDLIAQLLADFAKGKGAAITRSSARGASVRLPWVGRCGPVRRKITPMPRSSWT